MKKIHYILLFVCGLASASDIEPPVWLSSIPYEKDAFLGVGSGENLETASENAKIDILMQLSSKVDSTICLSGDLTEGDQNIIELCKAVITTNTLRGAETADTYISDGIHYVLLRYCESCGSILVSSALRSAAAAVTVRPPPKDAGASGLEQQPEKKGGEDQSHHFNLDLQQMLEKIESTASSEAVKLQRELKGPPRPLIEVSVSQPEPNPEITENTAVQHTEPQPELQQISEDKYNTENIIVQTSKEGLVIRLINFLPNREQLSEKQINELNSLSVTLFRQLQKMGYKAVKIVGHANPEGRDDEEAELESLSRARAETMENFLSSYGVSVESISWEGGRELLGAIETPEGRSRNRRVDIHVLF